MQENVIKTFVVGGYNNYVNFINNVELVDSPDKAQLIVFAGGEDVCPELYECDTHSTTYYNKNRDLKEKEVFDSLTSNQICVGICRGSQFLCVMNGGRLVQNVNNHAIWGTHPIQDGSHILEITSTHHQMQYPFNLDSDDYEILFTSVNHSDFYEGDNIDPVEILDYGEPEIVLYHKKNTPKCLAIQGHPEMIPNSHAAKYIDELIQSLINNEF